MMKKYVQNFFLSLGSLVIFLLLFELAISSFWYAEHPEISCVVDDPQLGYRNKANCQNQKKAVEGKKILYNFNSCGFRSSDSHCDKVKNSKYRVLGIGDSFTYGAMVDEEEIYLSRAESLLKQDGISIEFINAGVRGYDLIQYNRFLEELLEFKPDIVLIGFLPNDLYADLSEKGIESRLSLYKKLDRQAAHENLYNQSFAIKTFKKVIANSSLVSFGTHTLMKSNSIYRTAYLAREGEESYLDLEYSNLWKTKIVQAEHLFREINAKVSSAGSELIVLMIPQRIQALMVSKTGSILGKDPYSLINHLRPIFEKEKITAIDYLDRLKQHDNPLSLYYPVDGHLTPEGQIMLGEFLYSNLKTHFSN